MRRFLRPHILKKTWKLILLYGGDQHSQDVLEVIPAEQARYQSCARPLARRQARLRGRERGPGCDRDPLANQYKKIVIAVNVGNEILVTWSDHKLTEDKAIEYVEQVRKAVRCPVTVADTFSTGGSRKPSWPIMWISSSCTPIRCGATRTSTRLCLRRSRTMRAFARRIPARRSSLVRLAGPATQSGEQHVPRAGGRSQAEALLRRAERLGQANNVTTFYFEAFDEPWKGTGTEGHWGLFSVDRKANWPCRSCIPN